MHNPDEIFLQPACCATESEGRLWCEHDAPEDCEDGEPWVRYVHADKYAEKLAEVEALRSTLKELRTRYHAAGRRPEECYEMSMIDVALAAGRG